MEQLHPSEIDLGLDRIKAVADRLGLVTTPTAQVITVAGTNGKGSCVSTMQTLLRASGQRVGSYTSPHLLCYNERVQIDGQAVTDEALCDAFSLIDSARQDVSLTYFEFGTLAAFYLFQEAKLDYWLLEVGLGGRLDAVNLIDPDIAIITPVAIDHEAWLGSDREKIGAEKAGILRPGCIALCADPEPPASVVEAIASQAKSSYFWGRDKAFYAYDSEGGTVLGFTGEGMQKQELILKDKIDLPLPSVAAAVQAVALCNLFDPQKMAADLEALSLPGRFQTHRVEHEQGVLACITDVAHNPHAANLLADRLSKLEGKKYGLMCVMKDKDITHMIRPLKAEIDQWYLCNLPEIPRSASADEIKNALVALGVEENKIHVFATVDAGMDKASTMALADDASLVVFGSFYTVAESMNWINKRSNSEVKNG